MELTSERWSEEQFFKEREKVFAAAPPGTEVNLKVLRDKKQRELKIALIERPPVDFRLRPR